MGGGEGWSVKDEKGKRIVLEIEKFPVCHSIGFRHDAIGNGEKREAVTRQTIEV